MDTSSLASELSLLKRTADMVGLEHPVFKDKFDLESSQQDDAYAQVALS